MALTHRQQQIALRIAYGWTNPEIGDDLRLSVFTVRNEVIGIMRKLKARNRSHVAFMVGRSNLGQRRISDLPPLGNARSGPEEAAAPIQTGDWAEAD